MTTLMNTVCLFLLSVSLYLALSPSCAGAVSVRRCHSIYKGFAQCLMALGDSLSDSAHKDTHHIHSICRSWDEFHDCANMAMAGCPEEASAVWESLRQESKKMQFSGNLYDMCSNRDTRPPATVSPRRTSHRQGDVNQESLRGRGTHTTTVDAALLLVLLPALVALLLLMPSLPRSWV